MAANEIEWSASGISRAAADGRYVRRFVGTTLTAETGLLHGANTLYNPNGPVSGGLPTNISSVLLSPSDGLRARENVRIMREQNAAILTFTRVNGTLAVPTALGTFENIGSLQFRGADGGGGAVYCAGLDFQTREAFTPTARGTGAYLELVDVGTTALKRVQYWRGGGVGIGEWLGSQATTRLVPTTTFQARNAANSASRIEWGDAGLGFFGAALSLRPTVTGSRGGNAALASLLTQLATLGLITDSTTA